LEEASELDNLHAEAARVSKQVSSSQNETEVLAALKSASQEACELVAPAAVKKMAEATLATETEHALERFAPLLHGNPRSMKRYINRYSVTRSVRTLEGSTVDTEALALWVLLEIRWPRLADHLQHHPDDIRYIDDNSIETELPDDLKALLKSAQVAEVVKSAPSTLTADLIRSCCGEQSD
jgi:hypothetical protein